jgi:hypothetical protein
MGIALHYGEFHGVKRKDQEIGRSSRLKVKGER